MTLSRLSDAAVQGNLATGRSQILAIPQIQTLQHFLEFLLGDLAGSALERAKVGQPPSLRQSDRRGIELDRVLEGWKESFRTITAAAHVSCCCCGCFCKESTKEHVMDSGCDLVLLLRTRGMVTKEWKW